MQHTTVLLIKFFVFYNLIKNVRFSSNLKNFLNIPARTYICRNQFTSKFKLSVYASLYRSFRLGSLYKLKSHVN